MPRTSRAAQAGGDSRAAEKLLVIPLSETTPEALTKLIKVLYSRQNLINAMAQKEIVAIDEEMITLLDDLKPDAIEKITELIDTEIVIGMVKGVTIDGQTLYVASPFESGDGERKEALGKVLRAMADKAFAAHYVKTVKLEPQIQEQKYFCHSYLMQLGFGGPEHKDLRAALLDHLQGYAAFRTKEQMDEHKERFIQRRREERQAREAEANEAD